MTVLIRLFPINMQIRDNINTLFSDKLITLGKIKSLISKNQLVFIVNNSKFNIVMTGMLLSTKFVTCRFTW